VLCAASAQRRSCFVVDRFRPGNFHCNRAAKLELKHSGHYHPPIRFVVPKRNFGTRCKAMKLFVTGICGRLGRAIAAEAEAQGHTVVGLDKVPWPAAKAPLPEGVKVIEGSYEEIPTMERHLSGCDAIAHTAGPHGEYVEKLDLSGFLRSNVESVARMLELASRLGVRRVALSSTMEILIGRNWTASGAAVVDEESTPVCDSAYSISRLLQEQLAKEFSRTHGVSIGSLRYMAFGYEADKDLGPHLLARSLTPSDVARAVLRVASMDDLRGDVFNIGPKTPLTNEDIIAAKTNPEAVVERYFPGAFAVLKANGYKLIWDDFWPVTSIRKAKLILGWEPQYTFETWLGERGWKRKYSTPLGSTIGICR
jgi:nucleoside-diphosphate-sugar epimerase